MQNSTRVENTENLTDHELFARCEQYGGNARMWLRKFAGLLPEVARRNLHQKKGFQSIFEFAAKLGGMSKEQVQRILHLDKNFEDKPQLRAMLQAGAVSVHKLARVSAIVTTETEKYWAEQIRILPKSALETLVRDARAVPGHEARAQRAPYQTGATQELHLSQEVKQKLLELQNKGLDLNTLLLEFLKNREEKIVQEKQEISENLPSSKSRYISARIKNLLKQEHGTKCSIATCHREATVTHHTQRFSLSRNHDPHYLAPLCKDHHTIAHSIDRKFMAYTMHALTNE